MPDAPVLSARLRGLDARAAFLAAVALFLVTTAWGVLNDGFHSDDWRHLNGTSPLWTADEGRWLLEVIFRDLLGERFLLPVQLVLAFPCLWFVARVLARRAAPATVAPAAALAIFAVAVNHIFLADALSFAANVFAYPFALALSVAAFELLWQAEGRGAGRQALTAVAAAQLLAFSMAIYQTFAVAGLILPVLALLRVDSVRFAAALRLALIGAAASVLAILLYLAEWRGYAALQGVEIGPERFSGTDAAGFSRKLAALPSLLRNLHTGALMTLPSGLRRVIGLFSLATVALLALAWVAAPQRGAARLLAGARLGIGAGLALFVFPVLFWLGYTGDYPPARAFGYIGYWETAIFVAGLTLVAGAAAWRHALLQAGALTLVALAAVFALTASAFWSDNARLGARDEELARAIRARLATLPGYTGPPFRLVGTVDYPELSWGSIAGWSSFHAGNPNIGIFRALFGDRVETGVLPASPRACPAFPAEAAAFIHDGIAYVCLEELPAFTDALACAPLAAGGKICLGPGVLAHVAPTCLPKGPGDPEMRVGFHYDGRAYAPESSFTLASDAVRMADGCYTLALAPDQKNLSALTVRLVSPDGQEMWSEQVARSDLAPIAR